MDIDWDSVLNSAGGGAIIGGAIGAIIGIAIYGLRFIIRTFSGNDKAKVKNRDSSRWGDGR